MTWSPVLHVTGAKASASCSRSSLPQFMKRTLCLMVLRIRSRVSSGFSITFTEKNQLYERYELRQKTEQKTATKVKAKQDEPLPVLNWSLATKQCFANRTSVSKAFCKIHDHMVSRSETAHVGLCAVAFLCPDWARDNVDFLALLRLWCFLHRAAQRRYGQVNSC